MLTGEANKRRCERGEDLLATYTEKTGTDDLWTTASDLIADILHAVCDGLDERKRVREAANLLHRAHGSYVGDAEDEDDQ